MTVTPELPKNAPAPAGTLLADGTDLRRVKVLPKAEFDRITSQLNRRAAEEERLAKIRAEKEFLIVHSKEMVNSWGNTLAVSGHF